MYKGKEAKERIWFVDISKTRGEPGRSCRDEAGRPPRDQLMKSSECQEGSWALFWEPWEPGVGFE